MNKILNSIRFVPQVGDKQEFLCYLIMLVSQKYEKKMNERRKEKKNSTYFSRFLFSSFLIISFTESGVFCGSNIVDINELRIVDMFFNCIVSLCLLVVLSSIFDSESLGKVAS